MVLENNPLPFLRKTNFDLISAHNEMHFHEPLFHFLTFVNLISFEDCGKMRFSHIDAQICQKFPGVCVEIEMHAELKMEIEIDEYYNSNIFHHLSFAFIIFSSD